MLARIAPCLALFLACFLAPLVPNAEANAGVGELLEVPLRWCALRGSDAVLNPSPESSTNDVLWRRHERASDRVWIPGATITFRSAFVAAIKVEKSFPIIDNTPAGPGGPADVLRPDMDPEPLRKLLAKCDEAWDALLPPDQALVGYPAVNIHSFVNSDGSPVPLATLAGQGFFGFNIPSGTAVDLCTIPPTITAGQLIWNHAGNGGVGIVDYSLTKGPDPDEIVLAHELGHSLSLDHGNGLDDNGNGRYDGYTDSTGAHGCDPTEDEFAPPFSVMTPGGKSSTVSDLQRQQVRTVASHIPGVVIDPPGALVNADAVSDMRTDPVGDVFARDVDLTSVRLAKVPSTDALMISHSLFGVIPKEGVKNQYLLFADLDNDITTGGKPADIGFGTAFTGAFKTAFRGAELVTRVVVGPGHEATPTVWVFRDGSFQEVKGDFHAKVSSIVNVETKQPVADVVSLELPANVRGPIKDHIRIQAIAEQLQGGRELDIMPNGSLDGSAPITLVPPVFPVCAVTPPQANRGETVTVEVSGLLPTTKAHVVLGDVLVATGTIDGKGAANIKLVLPGDTRLGPRLVTVGVDGTALTADCLLKVHG